jgi:hypothetical protein
LIDDFTVTQSDWNEAGRALLSEAHRLATAAGAVQTVVVCARLDGEKRNFLCSEGLFHRIRVVRQEPLRRWQQFGPYALYPSIVNWRLE